MTASIETFTSRSSYLNRARDLFELANEERAVALSMNKTISAFSMYALTAEGVVVLGGVAAYLNPTKFAIISTTPSFMLSVIGLALLQLATVALVAYMLWRQNSYLVCAKNYEWEAVNYNSKAAELPPWSGMGIISGFVTRLLSCGNPVTNFGSDTLAGRRNFQANYDVL